MVIKEINNFKNGQIDSIEAQSIPDGAANSGLNWLSLGDKIELRRGYDVIGTEQTGIGKVTGIHVAKRTDGTEILYYAYGQKLKYYDTVTADFVEVDTADLFGADADGEDVSFSDYHSLAGQQTWLSSPNSSLYKIMQANPATIVDQYDSTKNFKGLISVILGRMYLWGRVVDKTGIYGSKIDNQTYTAVTAEVLGTGDGATKAFSGTLAFKAAGAKRTCFAISVTDGTETFTDDYNGVLTGSAGGSGTINYATGAISVTFNANVTNLQNVTVDYQWEDSTVGGIADFTKSATRLAAEGFIFRQDDGGGETKNILTYNDIEYCLHEYKTWKLTLSDDDLDATNRIWRENVGLPNWRAAVPTGDGIYYIDDTNASNPLLRLLTLDSNVSEVIPVSISQSLKLDDYRFDKGACFEWGEYVLFACRHKDVDYNNRVILYHKIWRTLDYVDYYVSCFASWEGKLIAGDSITNNVYELFSGFDDDESTINNHWTGNLTRLDIQELKKCKKLVIQGHISIEQSIDVYLSIDNGSFVNVGTISGTGDYIDRTSPTTIGSRMVGETEIGGGGDGTLAYNYVKEIKLHLDKFEQCQIKFMATGLGYASISAYKFWDLRLKGPKLPKKYRVISSSSEPTNYLLREGGSELVQENSSNINLDN